MAEAPEVIVDRPAPRSSRSRSARHAAACDFIDQNLARANLAPALVAANLSISVRQLHMLFAPTGRSFSRFVLERRLDAACRYLIAFPERRVIDIALACGIRSSTVFYRAFRHAYGMNPTQYRSLRTGQEAGAPIADAAP